MDFKIPKKFQLGGVDIEVVNVPHIGNTFTSMGQCDIIAGKVEIADNARGIQQSESAKLNTFFHELVHLILDSMGEYKLSENEKFVCTFSSLLTGAIRTME